MAPRFSDFTATLWYATAPAAPATGPLQGELRADVCIVGAGYSGLTTALELARQGVSVVVLERAELGFGGSGRNAGHCTPTFTHFSLPELRKVLGTPWAERLIRRQTRANDKVAEMVQRHAIDCEWEQNGYVQGALFPSHLKTLRGHMESYNAVGARTRMLDRDEAEAITGSPRFYGGWLHEEAGGVNALAYARGLGRAVLEEGGQVFTGSGVTGCTRAEGAWRVATPGGAVLAEKVIYTTGAYTVAGWPKLEETFRIMRVFVAATQPLSAESQAAVLPRRTTIQDGRGDIYVYKYNRENRIVASMFPMGARGRNPAYTRQVLSDRLRWLHPGLKEELRWDFFWYGELDMQRLTVPRLYGLAPGVVAMTGLSGRGVPTGSMLGGILSDWALGRPEADLDLRLEPLSRQPLYMSVAPQAALRGYRLRDRLRALRQKAPLPPHA
ncbi:FAD-binding oxidoreductase [Pseudooceanicola sp. CBS1P-1]|uniref:FAD-dependent oxidoreductase n=1 Tax=Pseudooceanicola albus TaxID=2692189 RepID=A0A6L7G8J0_9RHOB|nr:MULTISPECIES: FAD-binding oxidoreductase [Pseudooceanicola]MBT9384300.1 FAD-binding oxidoreductase [Pseudooceanicola endophyticus]MXN19962.1 FAD-dependent oxidoreductase [Pseudooceanicola albus]